MALGGLRLLALLSVPLASADSFLQISDIHLNLYYQRNLTQAFDCVCTNVNDDPSVKKRCTPGNKNNKYGAYGCDSSLTLLQSALDAMKKIVPKPAFIAVTGDFERHKTDPKLVDPVAERLNITQIIFSHLDAAFPDVPKQYHLSGLGNSDLYPEYNIDVESRVQPYLNQLGDVLKPYLDDYSLNSFKSTGYYSSRVGKLWVVVLNTIVWSTNHKPDQTPGDPFGQLNWLRGTCDHAQKNGEKVLITGHIPPGQDEFFHKPLWHKEYVAQYIQLVNDFRSVIVGQLFGHEHVNGFRLMSANHTVGLPVLLASSVSPYFNNTPTFRVFDFDPNTYEIKDFTVWHAFLEKADGGNDAPLPWEVQFSARNRYQLPGNKPLWQGLQELPDALKNNKPLMDNYIYDKWGDPALYEGCDDACRRLELCDIQFPVLDEFNACLK